MKKKFLIFFIMVISMTNIFAQNDTTQINDNLIPDSVISNFSDDDITNDFVDDSFVLTTQLQSQRLLKNLFLVGFIFMTLVVVFLFYINNVKIKQILTLVKQQERQVDIKNFEIEKLSVILNNTIDAIAIIDEDNNILWNNSSFLSLYGYEKEELKDKKIDFFTSEDSNIQELLKKSKESKTPVQFTFDFSNKDNQTIFVQRRIIPFTDSEDKVLNFAIIDTDYTALKIALGNK